MAAHDIALILKELGIVPVATVDRADVTKGAISLQPLSATGRDRDKAHGMHLLWGSDRGKYTPFMDELRNDFLKGNTNYPKMVSEA